MSLAPGQQLSFYEILAPLGSGGMGEVWRARDTRLGREVAIKVLSAGMAADGDSLARFAREARTLAQLNHPNIATIHGIDAADGVDFLTMELVAGEDLAAKLRRGRMPLAEALGVCRQIADGLEAAHAAGVVHRDLKPANVRITPGGVAKLLDFGLAKPLRDGGDDTTAPTSRTASHELTRDGMVLGTPIYMSPEQARGQPVDQRTDVWAFGCVLFELLTGRRPFAGETVSDTIAAVLTQEPDWSALPEETPASVRRLLRRALAKDQARRLRDIADARLELEEPEPLEPAAKPPSASGRRTATTLAAVAALAFAAVYVARARAPTPDAWRGEPLGGAAFAMLPTPSPDGQLLAFGAMVDGLTQVALMKPQTGNWKVLTSHRSAGTVNDIAWANDGSRIYFQRARELETGIYSVPVLGGDERPVLAGGRGVEVLPDGSLLTTRLDANAQSWLCRFWPEDGREAQLPAFVSSDVMTSPAFHLSHDGRSVIYIGRPLATPEVDAHLFALDIDSGQSVRLAPDSQLAGSVWSRALATSRDDRLVYFAQPFGGLHRVLSTPIDGSSDLRTVLTTAATPSTIRVAEDRTVYVDQLYEQLELAFFPAAGGGEPVRLSAPNADEDLYALPLADGRVVYAANVGGRDRLLVTGSGTDASPLFDIDEETAGPLCALGPDRLVLIAGAGTKRVLAIASIAEARIVRRLSEVDATGIVSVTATADGRTIVFAARGSAWTVGADGGPAHLLGPADAVAAAPDGRSVVVTATTSAGVRLSRLPLDGGSAEAIALPDGMKIASELAPNAVASDGRIAIRPIHVDSWFWPGGILDPRTGAVELVVDARLPSTNRLGWTPTGDLFAMLGRAEASIWRYRAE